MKRGFTLIELVVVMSVLAILTAVATPRFINLQRDTRIGQLQSIRGALTTGVILVHANLLGHRGEADAAACPGPNGGIADNQMAGEGSTCTDHGLVQTMHGYPASSVDGIVAAARTESGHRASAQEFTADGYAVSFNSGTTRIERIDAPVPLNCSITYSEPAMTYTAPVFSPLVTSGC